jgi:hypothetical protein
MSEIQDKINLVLLKEIEQVTNTKINVIHLEGYFKQLKVQAKTDDEKLAASLLEELYQGYAKLNRQCSRVLDKMSDILVDGVSQYEPGNESEQLVFAGSSSAESTVETSSGSTGGKAKFSKLSANDATA